MSDVPLTAIDLVKHGLIRFPDMEQLAQPIEEKRALVEKHMNKLEAYLDKATRALENGEIQQFAQYLFEPQSAIRTLSVTPIQRLAQSALCQHIISIPIAQSSLQSLDVEQMAILLRKNGFGLNKKLVTQPPRHAIIGALQASQAGLLAGRMSKAQVAEIEDYFQQLEEQEIKAEFSMTGASDFPFDDVSAGADGRFWAQGGSPPNAPTGWIAIRYGTTTGGSQNDRVRTTATSLRDNPQKLLLAIHDGIEVIKAWDKYVERAGDRRNGYVLTTRMLPYIDWEAFQEREYTFREWLGIVRGQLLSDPQPFKPEDKPASSFGERLSQTEMGFSRESSTGKPEKPTSEDRPTGRRP